MHPHRLSLSVLTMFFVFLSCNRIEEQAYSPVNEHTFSVTANLPEIEQETETKGFLGSFISASWTINDKVSVVNLTNGKILGGNLVADRSGISAKFSGTVTGSINSGDIISLIYPPFDNTEETDFGTRNISIAEQSAAANVPLVAYSTFTAEDTDGTFSDINLNFYYIISYLKINMANLPASVTVPKVTLRNIPDELTLSINDNGNGFDAATDEEKAAAGKIDVIGPFTTSPAGALIFSVGVMPSDASTIRSVMVTTDSYGDFLSPMTSAQLQSHKYYNTIVSQFEKVSLAGQEQYGIYDLSSSSVIDSYDEFASNVITGVEDDEADFTLLNLSSFGFWTLKGIPSDASEGTTFTARIYSNGIANLPTNTEFENAKVSLVEPDGDYSKLWVKAGDNLFIVRK